MGNKLLILDVDGVMTDGTKAYGPDGKVLFKRFCDHDWTAIKCFQRDGWHVCFLSADRCVNEAVANDRGIPFHYSRRDDGTIDKVVCLQELILTYATLPKDVVYVGDDLFDLPIMEAVMEKGGKAYCPNTAVPQVRKQFARTNGEYVRILGAGGGQGAIMKLYMEYSSCVTPPNT